MEARALYLQFHFFMVVERQVARTRKRPVLPPKMSQSLPSREAEMELLVFPVPPALRAFRAAASARQFSVAPQMAAQSRYPVRRLAGTEARVATVTVHP
jgi:hypothetical protein